MKNIRVWHVAAQPHAAGYRDSAAQSTAALRMRWSAIHWFLVLMVLIPSALLVGLCAEASRTALLVGVVPVAYFMSALLFNRVDILVADDVVVSRLGPIPIWPSKRFPTADIARVVATQSISSEHASESTNVAWYVVAVLADREQRPITRQLGARGDAVFVARAIEKHLGIGPSADHDG